MPRVPFELSDYIIDFLYADPSALSACALACRSWAPAARFHLFRSVTLQNRNFTTPFQRLLDTSPDLGWYVRELIVAKFVDAVPSAPPPSPSSVLQECTPTAVERALPHIFAGIPALRTLSLSHVDMKCIPDLKGFRHPSVSALSLSYCQFSQFADIVDLVACFPNLAELSLAGLTWREESRVCYPAPMPFLRKLVLGRDTDSEVLFAWFEAVQLHASLTTLVARCATEHDAELVGQFLKLAGPSLQHLDLDWSMSGDKTVVLPESVTLSNSTALEQLTLHFPVQYSTSVPWVTALLSTLNNPSPSLCTPPPPSSSGAIRAISCNVRLLGSIDALDLAGLGKLLSSEAYRTLEGLTFAVNLWSGVHKDFAEVEGLIRARLAPLDKKGVLHVISA